MKIGKWFREGEFPGVRKAIRIILRREEGDPLLPIGPQKLATMRQEDKPLDAAERFAYLHRSEIPQARIIDHGTSLFSQEPGEIRFIDVASPYRTDKFLAESKIITFKKDGKVIKGEVIINPEESCARIMAKYYSFIDQIAQQAWGKFPREWIVDRFIKGVTKAVLFRDGETGVGILAFKRMDVNGEPVDYIEIALMHPDYRENNLVQDATFNYVLDVFLGQVKDKIVTRQGSEKELINWIKTAPVLAKAGFFLLGLGKEPPKGFNEVKITISYVAVQPIVYGLWVKFQNIEIAPDVRGAEKPIPRRFVRIAESIIPENARFDFERFVLEGDYKGIEHLIIKPNEVQWHHDERVNKLFRERVRYEDMAGRDIIVVVSFGLKFFREYLNKLVKAKLKGFEVYLKSIFKSGEK